LSGLFHFGGAIVTEFTLKLRHYCRNPRCRSKLTTPVVNEREAFCCRGCHTQFYRTRCLACENVMERKTEHQLVCGKRKCRNALRDGSAFGRYHGASRVVSPPETSIKPALKVAVEAERACHFVPGAHDLCAVCGRQDDLVDRKSGGLLTLCGDHAAKLPELAKLRPKFWRDSLSLKVPDRLPAGIIPNAKEAGMYRLRLADGSLSDMASLTRIKDAARSHGIDVWISKPKVLSRQSLARKSEQAIPPAGEHWTGTWTPLSPVAGPQITANQFHCAVVGAGEALAEADRINDAHWRAAKAGKYGYRRADVTAIAVQRTAVADAGAAKRYENPANLDTIPDFLRRPLPQADSVPTKLAA
jgi:hypothetical protein